MSKTRIEEGFPERLRSERSRLELSQETVAKLCNVSQQTVHKYEAGTTTPTISFIYSLEELGFNTRYMIFGEGSKDFSHVPLEVVEVLFKIVDEIEAEQVTTKLSSSTKHKMLLTLLKRFKKDPENLPVTKVDMLELMWGGVN
nr:helix-turn-helix domain-containing protein [uncultured Undibacterium sp.]